MRTSVLVVDDDSDFRRVMRTILEDAGFTVFEASNGTAALAQLAQLAQLADGAYGMVVLLDLLMPGINGLDVLHALAQDEQLATRHAFTVVTATDTRALPVEVLRLLIQLDVPLLEKPFHIDDLLEVIGAAKQRLTPLSRFHVSDA
jgi:CheY-like chemotaxis protein